MLDLRIIKISLNPLILLRRAQISDFEYIVKISHAEMDNIVPQSWNWESWLRDIENHIMNNHHKIFVIEVQNNSVGYLWLNEEKNSLWITAIVLQTEYQRHTIGQNIMDYLIDESRKERKEFIELGVQHNNTKALRFYSKMGFERFDHVKSVNTDLLRLRFQ